MKRDLKFILLPIVALAIFGLGMYFISGKNASTNTSPEQASFMSVERADAPGLGSPSAKIRIVEFFDPECEACAAFHPVLKSVLKDFSEDVYFSARYMLYHGNSQEAANALEASRVQGKFWEMQDLLFVKQEEWSHKKESAMPIFEKYAQELKLDLTKFKADALNPALRANITKDVADGNAAGVRGTPSFYINNKPLAELSDTGLRQAIVEEIKRLK